MKDYHGNPLEVGDTIRNIESGWRGVIQAVRTFDAAPCDGGPYLMLECLGVNWWTGDVDEDDMQWHAPADVLKSKAGQTSEAPNPVNFL